jgi:hypothetical protein
MVPFPERLSEDSAIMSWFISWLVMEFIALLIIAILAEKNSRAKNGNRSIHDIKFIWSKTNVIIYSAFNL